jgi:hypothetical protein
MLELYQVLIQSYGVPPPDVLAGIERFTRTRLDWLPLNSEQGALVLDARRQHRLDAADAHLLQLARDDAGTLVTLDRRLLRVARALGVAVHNPISPGLAIRVARWEEAHLPAKGLGRFLRRTEQWLRADDPRVTDRFVQATDQLTKLPV